MGLIRARIPSAPMAWPGAPEKSQAMLELQNNLP